MAKKKTSSIGEEGLRPDLFGQKHSSRDYSDPDCWGKNQFNSSFPASLVAYMSSKGVDPIYLRVNSSNEVEHTHITPTDVFGIDPLSDEAFYNYEAGYFPFEKYYSGKREHVDLVMGNARTSQLYRGLEVKLTALPDNTTKMLNEDKTSCEIVMRPPTICFLACSICQHYEGEAGKEKLRRLLSGVPQVRHWEEPGEVAAVYQQIEDAVLRVSKDMVDKQTPLIIQPVWKTLGNKMILADDCLDVFVWSNLAVIQMCKNTEQISLTKINRFQRAIIWIYLMLFDYLAYNEFNYITIVKDHSYGNANDKAFSMPGTKTYPFLHCNELTHPRISKYEIKNIILGGGQNLLSPERRFDAVLVNSPDIFD